MNKREIVGYALYQIGKFGRKEPDFLSIYFTTQLQKRSHPSWSGVKRKVTVYNSPRVLCYFVG